MYSSSRMRRAVPEPPLVGRRNCRNLRKILMPSMLHGPSRTKTTQPTIYKTKGLQDQATQDENLQATRGCHKCKSKRCIICSIHLKETTSFTSTTNNTTYFIRNTMSCKSTNLVYLIDCASCNKVQYVGETQQTLQKRMYGHRHNIKHYDPKAAADPSSLSDSYKQDTMVAKHFNEPGHSVDDLRCMTIEQIHVQDATIRKRREKFWRHQLQTNYPEGLNVFD